MDALSFLTRQLPYLAPALVVYLTGVVLALVYLRRHAAPAVLVLIASVLLIVVSLAVPLLQGYLLEQGMGWMMWVAIGGSVLRSVGFGLLLAAAFIGRRRLSADSYSVAGELSMSPGTSAAPHRGALVLVLGILSLIICAPLGIAAWVMGGSDLTAMRSGRMDRSGESLTTVGYVLGIIGTVLFGLQVVVGILLLVAAGAIVQGGR